MEYLNKAQIAVIVKDEQFIKKMKSIQYDLKMKKRDAFNELIAEVAYTSRNKVFLDVTDHLTAQQHAHLEYAKKDIIRHYATEKANRQDNEVSIEKLKIDSMNEWSDGSFEVTYEMNENQYEDVDVRFSQRERKAVLDSLDYILSKPSAKFVRYLMTYGESATMDEFGLDAKYFNMKVKDLVETIKRERTRQKIEAIGLHSDTFYAWQDDIEELQFLSESGSGEDIVDYVMSHEGNEAYWNLYTGLNYGDLLYLKQHWDEDKKARVLGYKLMDNIAYQLDYMTEYIYY